MVPLIALYCPPPPAWGMPGLPKVLLQHRGLWESRTGCLVSNGWLRLVATAAVVDLYSE